MSINPKFEQRVMEWYEMANRRAHFYYDDPERKAYYEGMRHAMSLIAMWIGIQKIGGRYEDFETVQSEVQ